MNPIVTSFPFRIDLMCSCSGALCLINRVSILKKKMSPIQSRILSITLNIFLLSSHQSVNAFLSSHFSDNIALQINHVPKSSNNKPNFICIPTLLSYADSPFMD